jgi:two-component system phosphate regulon response regulator PhoB
MANILLVEDDLDFADNLRDWLRHQKHVVDLAPNGSQALDKLKQDSFDLIILDWELPDLSGIEILKQYRDGRPTAPVIMLTGRGQLDDKTTGLDGGADNYLVKPVEPPVLNALIRAILRREEKKDNKRTIGFGDLEIDTIGHKVSCHSVEIKLAPAEFDCLLFLATHSSKGSYTAEALLARVWQQDDKGTLASVRQCLSQIRKKLQSCNSQVEIVVEAGTGYSLKLASESQAESSGKRSA